MDINVHITLDESPALMKSLDCLCECLRDVINPAGVTAAEPPKETATAAPAKTPAIAPNAPPRIACESQPNQHSSTVAYTPRKSV